MSVNMVASDILLQTSDISAVESFEKSFYNAYKNIAQQKLIRQIWDWDDEQERIALKCPIESTTIFTWQEKGKTSFYVAGTFDRTVFSQLEFYSFKKPENVGHYGEVFTLFATPWMEASIFEIERLFLKPICYSYVKNQGATHLLATCSQRMLILYKKWGWDILEAKTIAGEERYFIQRAV